MTDYINLTKPEQDAVIAALNELYITTRKKYLLQTDERYLTFDRDTNDNIIPLNDSFIKTHLKGTDKKTYGVFAAGSRSKFLTFDVDIAGNEQLAKWTAMKLVNVLMDDFNISAEDIHVSFSGNKGYHVDLIFDETIAVATLKEFHAKVIAMYGKIEGGDIEFRPTWQQGVKLPLGIHQKTGNRAWYCDTVTLDPIEDFTYITTIRPMDANEFLLLNESVEVVEVVEEEKAEQFVEVAEDIDMTVSIYDADEMTHRVADVLNARSLPYPQSRHHYTYMIALFANTQGIDRDDATDMIMDVLYNTPSEYFSEGSDEAHWEKEAIRLTDYVYDNGKTIMSMNEEVEITKQEVEAVLKVGTFKQKQVAYAMLIHAKRYGGKDGRGTFFMTFKQLREMTETNSDNTINNALKKLEEVGFIEYVQRGKYDKAFTKRGIPKSLPNKYRLTFDLDEEKEQEKKSVSVGADTDLEEVARELFTLKELRKYVKRHELNTRFRPYYIA